MDISSSLRGMPSPLFYSKAGEPVPGLDETAYRAVLHSLSADFFLTDLQIAEAASYSMAMVVRYALGLSAAGGGVTALASDTLSGQVALATVRHLLHGGAQAALFILSDGTPFSPSFERQIQGLEKLGLERHEIRPGECPETFMKIVGNSHNVICGVTPATFDLDELIEHLNDSPIPIHTVEAPPGVDLTTGKGRNNPLFASSTLSLGVPLSGLWSGRDFVGRHYVCDISLPHELLLEHGVEFPLLFSEQPVQQITPEPPTTTAPHESS